MVRTFRINDYDSHVKLAEEICEYSKSEALFLYKKLYRMGNEPEFKIEYDKETESFLKEEILSLLKNRVSAKSIFIQIEEKMIKMWIQIFVIYNYVQVCLDTVVYDRNGEKFATKNVTQSKDFTLYLFDKSIYKRYKSFAGHLKLMNDFDGYKFPPRNRDTENFYCKYDELEYFSLEGILIARNNDDYFVLVCTKNNYLILNEHRFGRLPQQNLMDYVIDILDNFGIEPPDDINAVVKKYRILKNLQ